MFDFRYHALSLAAVLIALAVGLLLGVAIGDANLVSNAEKRVVDSLRGDLGEARAATGQVRAELDFHARYEAALYPQFVGGALRGRRIGLIFLGAASDQTDGLVRTALEPTGAQIVLVAAVRDPLDAGGLAAAAARADPRFAAFGASPTDPGEVGRFATRMGVQLVRGGRLLAAVQPVLLSSYNGSIERLDGVVLVRAPGNVDPAAQQVNAQFESGLAAGLGRTGVPVVGVETTSTQPSQIPWYTQQTFSSVDDLEGLPGSTALVELLSGAHGAFGRKSTATAILPPLAAGRRP